MDGWMDGWMDAWMDGWMHAWLTDDGDGGFVLRSLSHPWPLNSSSVLDLFSPLALCVCVCLHHNVEDAAA